jgi:hypothetical protein
MTPRQQLERLRLLGRSSIVGADIKWAVEEIEQLRTALVQAVSVIQTWHNMEVPEKQRSALWDIYWRNAPELKQIREALRGDTP